MSGGVIPHYRPHCNRQQSASAVTLWFYVARAKKRTNLSCVEMVGKCDFSLIECRSHIIIIFFFFTSDLHLYVRPMTIIDLWSLLSWPACLWSTHRFALCLLGVFQRLKSTWVLLDWVCALSKGPWLPPGGSHGLLPAGQQIILLHLFLCRDKNNGDEAWKWLNLTQNTPVIFVTCLNEVITLTLTVVLG